MFSVHLVSLNLFEKTFLPKFVGYFENRDFSSQLILKLGFFFRFTGALRLEYCPVYFKYIQYYNIYSVSNYLHSFMVWWSSGIWWDILRTLCNLQMRILWFSFGMEEFRDFFAGVVSCFNLFLTLEEFQWFLEAC